MTGRLDDSFKSAPKQAYEEIPQDVLSVIEACWEYMDQRADISNETDDDGSPRPNEEMRLAQELLDILEKADK